MQTIAFALGGERYRVTCEREADARLIAFWSARMQDHGGGPVTEVVLRTTPDGGLVEIDGALELRQTSVEDLWPALEGWLYQRLMASQLGQRLVVHAACLAFRGGAWLFSGESGAGKSVLSARLSQRGWTYLTDEFALLDATERVWPVPRPISFRADELPARSGANSGESGPPVSTSSRGTSATPSGCATSSPTRRPWPSSPGRCAESSCSAAAREPAPRAGAAHRPPPARLALLP